VPDTNMDSRKKKMMRGSKVTKKKSYLSGDITINLAILKVIKLEINITPRGLRIDMACTRFRKKEPEYLLLSNINPKLRIIIVGIP
jgi:hypothetical protein